VKFSISFFFFLKNLFLTYPGEGGFVCEGVIYGLLLLLLRGKANNCRVFRDEGGEGGGGGYHRCV